MSMLKLLRNLCQENDILLIKDCAIYFGNYTLKENQKIYAGSIGDVSIFSFGIMKNICAIFGGSLVTSNEEIYKFATKKNSEFKKFPNFLYFKKILLYIVLKISLSRFVYNYFFFHIIKIATAKKILPLLNLFYPALKFKSKINLPKNYYSKISGLSLNIINNYLKKNDYEKEINKRMENNKIYQNYFDNHEHIKIIKIKDFNYQNFLDYPIITKKRDDLVKFLLSKGLETRFHFYSNCDDIIEILHSNNSINYENQLICLPSHPKISSKKIEEYCYYISEFYGSNN